MTIAYTASPRLTQVVKLAPGLKAQVALQVWHLLLVAQPCSAAQHSSSMLSANLESPPQLSSVIPRK